MDVRAVEYHDLEFNKVRIKRYSSRGVPYHIGVDVGVPKIQGVLVRSAFYLYRTDRDAEAGSKYGGTGFFAGVQSKYEGRIHLYGVSNWHVAIRDGCSVIRVNTKQGDPDILHLDPGLWTKHPDGLDIAIAPLEVNLTFHEVGIVMEESFASKDVIEQRGIGVGDDCFMVGRFIDHAGGPTNRPAARFGNLSVMPSPIKQPTGVFGESYCVDLHSRTGYSGSPVFVYRTPGNNFDTRVLDTSDAFSYLLGIHWGQFPELWEITNDYDLSEAGVITEGQYVKGVSGMTCVIPAWHIRDMLYLEKFVKEREESDKEIAQQYKKLGLPPDAESAIDETSPSVRMHHGEK